MEKMRKYFRGLLALMLFFVASCRTEKPAGTGGGDLVEVVLSIQAPSAYVSGTYAPGTVYDGLTSLHALVFKIIGSGNETFESVAKIHGPEDGDIAGRQLVMKLRKDDEFRYRIVILANCTAPVVELLENPETLNGMEKKELMALCEIGYYGIAGNFPMWGQSDPLSVRTDGSGLTGRISLLRVMACVEVKNNAPNFDLHETYVFNVKDRTSIAPDIADFELNGEVTVPTANAAQDIAFVPFTGQLFLFDAPAATEQTFFRSTAVVVGGYVDGGIEMEYFRLDFANESGSYVPVLRNHSYVMNIQSVTGEGFSDPGLAYNGAVYGMAGTRAINAGVIAWVEDK